MHICRICERELKSLRGLSLHIGGTHGYRGRDGQRKYFDEYLFDSTTMTRECQLCGSIAKFDSVELGYRKYCESCRHYATNPTCVDYWILKGSSLDEAKKLVQETNRKRSQLRVEYWIDLGFTHDEAQSQISELQSKNSKKRVQQLEPSFYEDGVRTDQECQELADLYKRQTHPHFVEHWVRRYGKKEGRQHHAQFVKMHKDRVSKLGKATIDSNRPSLQKYIEKHGEKRGRAKWEDLNYRKGKSLRVEYFIEKGYQPETAQAMLKQRQDTRSICSIMRSRECDYDEAVEIRQRSTDKWLDSISTVETQNKMEEGRIKGWRASKRGWSTKSQDLFWALCLKVPHLSSSAKFATNLDGEYDDSINHEQIIKTDRTYRFLDFFIPDRSICIEFDGSYWHSIKSEEIETNRDLELLRSVPMFKILHIQEEDYDRDQTRVIDQCLNFIKENTDA